MEQVVKIRKYTLETGVVLDWEDEDYSICASVQENSVLIRADAAGLTILARYLLTLAQEGVAAGNHVHLDEFAVLDPGSAELILERSNIQSTR